MKRATKKIHMDIYYEIKEIKERQEKILSQLDTLIKGNSQEKLYNIADLADLLKVSKRTIFTWKKQGLLPCSQVTGKIWITDAQLKSFLEQNASNPELNQTSKIKRL
jgi:hypothetical protein